MSDITKIYWMPSTIHPTRARLWPKDRACAKYDGLGVILFLTHPEVLLFFGVLTNTWWEFSLLQGMEARYGLSRAFSMDITRRTQRRVFIADYNYPYKKASLPLLAPDFQQGCFLTGNSPDSVRDLDTSLEVFPKTWTPSGISLDKVKPWRTHENHQMFAKYPHQG